MLRTFIIILSMFLFSCASYEYSYKEKKKSICGRGEITALSLTDSLGNKTFIRAKKLGTARFDLKNMGGDLYRGAEHFKPKPKMLYKIQVFPQGKKKGPIFIQTDSLGQF